MLWVSYNLHIKIHNIRPYAALQRCSSIKCPNDNTSQQVQSYSYMIPLLCHHQYRRYTQNFSVVVVLCAQRIVISSLTHNTCQKWYYMYTVYGETTTRRKCGGSQIIMSILWANGNGSGVIYIYNGIAARWFCVWASKAGSIARSTEMCSHDKRSVWARCNLCSCTPSDRLRQQQSAARVWPIFSSTSFFFHSASSSFFSNLLNAASMCSHFLRTVCSLADV